MSYGAIAPLRADVGDLAAPKCGAPASSATSSSNAANASRLNLGCFVVNAAGRAHGTCTHDELVDVAVPGHRLPGAVAMPSFGSPPAAVGAGFGSASVDLVLGVGVVTVAPDCPLTRLCGTAGACPVEGVT